MNGMDYQAKPADFGISQLQYKNQDRPLNSLMSFSIGNRVLKDKLGIMVAGSYQNIYRGTNSTFYVPDEPAACLSQYLSLPGSAVETISTIKNGRAFSPSLTMR